MRKKEDTYEMWKRTNALNSKLDYIKAAASSFYSQKQMCQDLGITEPTFIQLKKKHPEIQKAINDGEAILLSDLFSSLKRKATGFKESVTTKSMEKNPIGGTKTKIHEEQKYYPPDFEAIKYILIMKFGKEYDPKKFMLEMMEKKNEQEVWTDVPDVVVGADDSQEEDK